MMKIKFRGLKLGTKEWVYGYYFKTNNGKSWITLNNPDGTYGDVEVISETVGQYVGLSDKNKIEIYQGDVVKNRLGTGIVTFACGSFFLENPNHMFSYGKDNKNPSSHFPIKLGDSEIVGDRWLNKPEVLQKAGW